MVSEPIPGKDNGGNCIMKGTIVLFASLLVIFLYNPSVFAWGGNHPPEPVHQQDEWPAGLAELLNREERVHGYWVNANDFFFFAGDTDAFNEFLEQYAALKNTPLRLALHPGVGMTGSLSGEKNIPFEWRVSVEKWHSDPSKAPTLVTMGLWLGGLVKLDKIKVPLNVEVKSGGEIERFVAEHSEHEARGKAKSPREAILPSPEMNKTTALPSGVFTTGEPDTSAEPPDREEAPDFSLQALNGKTIKLSDFRGKVVILNFWATWAPQHTREMVALEELYRTYQEELVVLGVSVDSVNSDNTDAVKAYIEKRSVTYPILIAPIDTLYDYEIACESPIVTIPTTIIIDKGGFIRSKHVGAQHKAALERAYLSARNGVDVPPRSHGRVGFTKTGKSSVWTVNRALRLDGDGYVIIHPFDIPATAITAEFWMKSSDTTKKGNPLSYQVEVGHSHHHMGSGQNVNWPAGVVR